MNLRQRFRVIQLGMLLAGLVITPPVLAQSHLDINQVAANIFPQPPEVEEPPANQLHQRRVARFNIEQNIDAWVFNRFGNEGKAREHLENQIRLSMDALDRECGLSEEQSQKLWLAGQGDMARFFHEVDEIRREFRGQQDQNKINQVWQRLQPLQMKMQSGLFGRDSIFRKVAETTLNEEQTRQQREDQARRAEFAYRASVKIVVAQIESSSPLRARQREQLVELLEQTRPPKMFGPQVHYYVLWQFSKSQDQIAKFLDEAQLEALRPMINQGGAMQQFLKQGGYLD